LDGVGAGEGPLFVPEQLAFDELFRDGGAVDRDEGLVPARGKGVEACGQLFPVLVRLRSDGDWDVPIY